MPRFLSPDLFVLKWHPPAPRSFPYAHCALGEVNLIEVSIISISGGNATIEDESSKLTLTCQGLSDQVRSDNLSTSNEHAEVSRFHATPRPSDVTAL